MLTSPLRRTLSLIDVRVLDHLIIAGNASLSFDAAAAAGEQYRLAARSARSLAALLAMVGRGLAFGLSVG